MAAGEYRDGDIVDIEIKGARVINSYTTGVVAVDGQETNTGTILVFRHPGEHGKADRSHTVNLAGEGVTVTVVEWPPRVDDLWADRRGTKWFAMENSVGDVLLTDRSGGRHGPEYVAGQHGPMNLVHREVSEP